MIRIAIGAALATMAVAYAYAWIMADVPPLAAPERCDCAQVKPDPRPIRFPPTRV